MGTHPIFESDFDCLTVQNSDMSSELACTYAALILNDDDVEITGDKISTILKAAKVDVEPFWPSLFAGALKDVNVRELITNIGSGFRSRCRRWWCRCWWRRRGRKSRRKERI